MMSNAPDDAAPPILAMPDPASPASASASAPALPPWPGQEDQSLIITVKAKEKEKDEDERFLAGAASWEVELPSRAEEDAHFETNEMVEANNHGEEHSQDEAADNEFEEEGVSGLLDNGEDNDEVYDEEVSSQRDGNGTTNYDASLQPQEQERTHFEKCIILNEPGALGLKVEEDITSPDGACLTVIHVHDEKQANAAGLRVWDVIIYASVGETKGPSHPDFFQKWDDSMPPHEFYKILLSKQRPIRLQVRREWGGEFDVKAAVEDDQDMRDGSTQLAPGRKRRRRGAAGSGDGPDSPSSSRNHKNGRPRKYSRISTKKALRPTVEKMRQWREDIIYAFELRLSADDLASVIADSDCIHRPKMRDLAKHKLKAQIASMLEEANELWSHPDHGHWEKCFKELLQFKHLRGNCQVTATNTHSESLVVWVENVRKRHRRRKSESMKYDSLKTFKEMEAKILNRVG
jgi:hypothetical protein